MLLYEGKAKQVYSTENENEYVVYYKDDATAFNGEKKASIASKGILNNKICTIMFETLEKAGIKTHFIKALSDREQLVKKKKSYNPTTRSYNQKYHSRFFLQKIWSREEGIVLDKPIFEMSYKNDEYGDPLINDDHAVALKLATQEEIDYIREQTLKINEIMKEFFLKMDLKLVDFKLEFGKDADGNIILADEISPDTCRLWDVNTNEKLDKDRFRRDLGDLVQGYEEVLSRMNK